MPLSCLWVIRMAIIRSGWVQRPRTVMELRPLTSQQCLVVISWLSAQPMQIGGTLDLLMTDVPDLVRVAVIAPIGNSDHSSMSGFISISQAVPNLCVRTKVFLKHQVNWNTVCGAKWELPWHNIWLLTILFRF